MTTLAREHAGCDPVEPKRERLTFSSLIAALSYALDLTEGAQPGHALRTCLIGMRIAAAAGLSQAALSDLYYALLLKDAGCSSNATRLHQIVGGDEIRAKAMTKVMDYERVEWKQISFLLRNVYAREKASQRLRAIASMIRHSSENAEELILLRCHQGALVVRALGLGQATADAVYNLDEHWNGLGYPGHLSGDAIPLLARIVSLAQTLEVFHSQYGPGAALEVIQRRSGRWFDPEMVRVAVTLIRGGHFWDGVDGVNLEAYVASLEPQSRFVAADDAAINNICGAFAGVVDAKSHSTYMHSTQVARIAVEVGRQLRLPEEELMLLHRAGLLHDIGKLSVPNSILDGPGRLSAQEWECVRHHPHFTFEILSRIPGFGRIARVAATHHEKLDGSGYFRGLKADQLSPMSRILTVSDMYEALSSNRPYRGQLTTDEVLGMLCRQAPHALDAKCFAALESVVPELAPVERPAQPPNPSGVREILSQEGIPIPPTASRSLALSPAKRS